MALLFGETRQPVTPSRHAVVLTLFPARDDGGVFASTDAVEIERAQDSGGAPGTATSLGTIEGLPPEGAPFVDLRPAGTALWWYRYRHIKDDGAVVGDWSGWTPTQARLIPRYMRGRITGVVPSPVQWFNVRSSAFGGNVAAAIRAAQDVGGGIVYLGVGRFDLAADLLLDADDVWLYGAGRTATQLILSDTGGDILTITGQRCKVSDVTLDYATAAASGTYALRMTDVGRCKIVDAIFGPNIYNGIRLESTAGAADESNVRNIFLRTIMQDVPPGRGLEIVGGSASRRVIDVKFNDCHFSGTSDAALLENWVQGTKFHNCVFDFSGRSVSINPAAELRTFDTFFRDCTFDGGIDNEYIRATNTHSLHVLDSWFGAVPAGVYGIHLTSTVKRSRVQDCQIAHKEGGTAGLGCVFVDGDANQVRGNEIIQGGVAPTNAAIVLGANADENDVADNSLEGFAEAKTITDAGGATVPNRIGPNYSVAFKGIRYHTPTDHLDYLEIAERADPAAPGTNRARLYVRDNGAGKTQLVVRFPTGVVQVIATEP